MILIFHFLALFVNCYSRIPPVEKSCNYGVKLRFSVRLNPLSYLVLAQLKGYLSWVILNFYDPDCA